MQNKINFHQILDSVEIPIIIISPVIDKTGEIEDYRIEFANQAIHTLTSGKVQIKQNLSKCVPVFSQRFALYAQKLHGKSATHYLSFYFKAPQSKTHFIITANKTKYNLYILTVKIPEARITNNTELLCNLTNDKIRKKLSCTVIRRDFELYFQPQFCIKNNKLRGFEALIRWHDAELGSVSPSCFIPIAEETSLIIQIGWWVLEIAIGTLKSWQLKYNFNGVICVNVSPVQLAEDTFCKKFCSMLQKYNINPNSLEIEITETVLIDDISQTVKILERIKKENVLISLDDFGTGYSSFKYLQKIPVNTLKLDKSIVDDITIENSTSAHIIKTVIDLSNKLGIKTIAEGVELSDQMEILKAMNCDIIQGFLSGKPMKRESCEKLLYDEYLVFSHHADSK